MKRILLAVLLTIIALNAPWRLMVLGCEVMSMSPGTYRTTGKDDAYWEALRLEARMVALSWRVNYLSNIRVPGVGLVYGVTFPDEHAIFVDKELHWNDRFAVLAHEGGHTQQPGWVSTGQGDAFAESVATLVSHDGFREHARYLANMKVDFLIMVMTEWPAIYHAAATLEDR